MDEIEQKARELLAGAYRVHGHFEYADILLNKPLVGEDYIAAYAIEQALTQQRGEVAWKHDAESWGNALNEAAWIFVEQCPEKSALLFNNTKAPLRAAILKYAELVGAATTPQPSADAVRELVKRWRSNGHPYVSDCADELESLLSGGSHA